MGDNSQQQASIQTNQFGDTYIDLVNEAHFQQNSAADIYRNIITDRLSDEKTLYVIIGTDSGLFTKHLNQHKFPEGTRYLFIELELIHPIAASQCTGQELSRTPITLPSDWEAKLDEMNLDHYIFDDKVHIIKSLAANQGHLPDYDDLFRNVKIRLEAINHELISTTSQIDFLKNRLLNTVDNILPAKLLENTASGTAIILAAGPSLNNHLEWVKQNRNKLTVIAVSRIYQQLQHEGIRPDIVVSVDPFPINFENSKAMLADDDFLFVHTNHVSHQLPAQWRGMSLFLDQLYPWETALNPENIENNGPTVTHTALALSLAMGFDKVLLAGVDLCFESDGLTHADGEDIEISHDTMPTVETYAGKMAYTNNNLLISIKYMTEIVEDYPNKVFNLSHYSANVPGIDYLALPFSIEGTSFTPTGLKQVDTKQRHEHVQKVKKELGSARLAYSEIIKLSKDAIRFNNGLHGKARVKHNPGFQQKLDKIEQKLNHKFQSYIPLAQLVASRDFLRLLNQNQQNRTADQEHQWLDNYYSAYQKGATKVIDAIESALRSIETRMIEYRPHIDIAEFIDRLEKGNLTGRSCVLTHNKESSALSSTAFSQLAELCQDFIAQISINRVALRKMQASLVLAKQDQWESAQQLMEEAYQSDKQLMNGFSRLGWIHAQQGKWSLSAMMMRMDIERNRISPDWKLLAAQSLSRDGSTDLAIHLVEDAYQENASLTDGYAQLGWIYTETRNWQKAWQIAKRDLEESRLTAKWKVHLALLSARQGDFDHAQKLVGEAYAEDNKLTDGYIKLGWIYTETEDLDKAWAIAKQDVEKNRLSSAWQMRLGIFFARQGDFDKANTFISQAYVSNSLQKDGYAKLGWVHATLGDLEQACKVASRDVEQDSLTPAWKITVAILLARQGNTKQAIELISEAYNADPHLKDGFARLGCLYMEQMNWEKAWEFINKDTEQDRSSTSWQLVIAFLISQKNGIREASDYVQKAINQLKDNSSDFKNWNAEWKIATNDISEGRLPTHWFMNIVLLLAAQGEFSKAFELVLLALSINANSNWPKGSAENRVNKNILSTNSDLISDCYKKSIIANQSDIHMILLTAFNGNVPVARERLEALINDQQ